MIPDLHRHNPLERIPPTMTATRAALAWHCNPDLKAEVVQRLREHRAADEIVQGLYQELDPQAASGYRGCAIGCTLPKQPARDDGAAAEPDSGWHGEVERLYGIPRGIGTLIDRTFESLPHGRHAEFAVASIEAVPVGADLSRVTAHLMLDLLVDAEHGVLRHTRPGTAQHTAVQTVVDLYRRHGAGEQVSDGEWNTARKNAAAAASAAAAYAYASAAASAAAAYAASAAASASAAAAYAYASAAASARTKHWEWFAETVLRRLTEAPVPDRAAP